MNEDLFLQVFYEQVPEMRNIVEKYLAEIQIDMSYGMDIVWGIGILPCTITLLEEPEKNEMALNSLFQFIEKMVIQDEITKGITSSWTFVAFSNEERILPAAYSFMQAQTKKLWDSYMEYMRQFQLWKLSQMEDN